MSNLLSRAPVVVVLGHVDHGKTTLLDTIKKTHVADREAGKITQKIGAYSTKTGIEGYETDEITFIDTPGHEAFSKLRLRGAQVADIAILIVDATDSVKPQTIESIFHIKNAGIPFIVAINKVDLPTSMPDKVKKDLSKHEVFVDGMGGTTPCIEISATKGTGIPDLLEALLLVSADAHLTYDLHATLETYIIESKQTQAGPEASCIIKNGQLKLGEVVYALDKEAKVKALIDDKGVRHTTVTPSMPFLLLGFSDVPEVGVPLTADQGVSEIIKTVATNQASTFAELFADEEKKGTLHLIIKADSTGSLEATKDLLATHETIEIDLAGIGDITKSDIFLAKLTKAVVIGFGIKSSKEVEATAKQERVLIKHYSIIYELVEEMQEVAAILQEKEKKQLFIKGEGKIIANFKIDQDNIAGVSVTKGKISMGDQIDLYRNDRLIGSTSVASLKQKARDIKELQKNLEGGLRLDPELDFKVGDVVKSYSI
ncbi:MAG: translation initiation factor IF-2 [Candidatus Roizmanbacteria bacterium]